MKSDKEIIKESKANYCFLSVRPVSSAVKRYSQF